MTLYFAAMREMPWDDERHPDRKEEIRMIPVWTVEQQEGLTDPCEVVAAGLLQYYPRRRLGMRDVWESDWLR